MIEQFKEKLWPKLKRFFFPPPGIPRWQRVLPYIILGALTAVALSGGSAMWSYTNSSPFCGTSCHTMPPQYSAYLNSPHARVDCVECHIGRDTLATQFGRKAGDLRHVFFNVTQTYEYPIRAHNMRPARDVCETCHFPEKFSDDSLREMRSFLFDEANSAYSIYLVMKTGGGTNREGLGRGIHWHIENPVQYLSTDDHNQEIPYVRVENADGTISEYYDVEAGLTADDIVGQYLETVDCITCHNRITHNVPDPMDAISEAIGKDLITTDLPYVVREGVALLVGEYPDKETAIESMASLFDFYEENYPDVYAERYDDIVLVVAVLREIYNQNVFPEQKADWDTHANNLGHKDDPGCFRCHDGKHFTSTGEAVRLECNLCHTIPVVREPGEFTTDIELGSGPEPPSHTHTSWIALHSDALNPSCANCHDLPEGVTSTADLNGKPEPDDSFCGNEACHGTAWTYSGFHSDAVEPILTEQLFHLLNTSPFLAVDASEMTYENTFSMLFEQRCSDCHNATGLIAGLDLTSYATVLQGGNSGIGIEPGALGGSLVYQRQSEGGHFSQMLDDELTALETWILAGAPEK